MPSTEENRTITTDGSILKSIKSCLEFLYILFPYTFYAYVYVIFRKIFPPSPKSLNNEIILITGTSSGLGRELVLYLAENYSEAKLVLWDCDELSNRVTVEKAKRFGASVFSYKIDVSDRLQVENCAEQVLQEVGVVTILFNNAGVTSIGEFLEQPFEKMENTINVNLIAHFYTLRAFLPSMIERNHGHIVTTASVASFLPFRFDAPYTASKFAVRGFLDVLKDELRASPLKTDNIRFTTVFPYFINTPLISRLRLQLKLNYWFMKSLEPNNVAKQMVEGMLRNQENIFLPGFWKILVSFKPLVPQMAVDKFIQWQLENSTYVKENEASKFIEVSINQSIQ